MNASIKGTNWLRHVVICVIHDPHISRTASDQTQSCFDLLSSKMMNALAGGLSGALLEISVSAPVMIPHVKESFLFTWN